MKTWRATLLQSFLSMKNFQEWHSKRAIVRFLHFSLVFPSPIAFFSMFSQSTLRSINFCFQIELLRNSINRISNSSMSIHENFYRFSFSISILSENLMNFAVSSSSLNFENVVKNCSPTDLTTLKNSFWRLLRSVLSSFWRSIICLLRFKNILISDCQYHS